jgi:hypothetical protein
LGLFVSCKIYQNYNAIDKILGRRMLFAGLEVLELSDKRNICRFMSHKSQEALRPTHTRRFKNFPEFLNFMYVDNFSDKAILRALRVHVRIFTCGVVRVTKIKGSSSGDWIY